jgi:hypothetical protein
VAGSVSGAAGPAPGLLWEDLAGFFAVDGSVKTVYVEGAGSMAAWQALADWVCAHGPDYRYAETGTAGPGLPVPAVTEIFARRSRLARPYLQGLSGWIAPGIRAWLVFSQFTPAWFLVSQEDIQSQAQLDVFVRALAALGRHLGRGLAVAHEWDTGPAGPILRYDPVTGAVSRP